MKATDITVEVKAKMTVDRRTAESCLKLVEMYVNDTGKNVIVHKTDTGELEFSYEPA